MWSRTPSALQATGLRLPQPRTNMKKALVLLPLALAFSLPSAVFANPGDYCIYDSDCGSATEKCIEQECQFFSTGASNTGGGGAGGVNTGKLQSLAGTITSLV